MVVEDADDTRDLIRIGLEAAGYRVISYQDSESALSDFRNHHPDLITIDVMIPGSNGIALLKEIRAIDENIPIVMVSAWGDFRQDFNVWSSNAYVVKSVDLIHDLLSTIQSILK